jgi:hypothetical protein
LKILLLNNDGAGFADYVDTKPGITVDKFLAEHLPHSKPNDLLIRVNRQPASQDQALQEGDRVSATPVKIHGAVG